jgi:hypothetical protein
MSNAILDGKGKNQEELEALEVAEAAREAEWISPSFVASLFMGQLRAGDVLPYPEQSDEDRRNGDALIARIDEFLKANVDADEIDRTGEIPPHAMKGLADLGLFGMKIPKEYGGLGLSQVNYGRAMSLLFGHCASTAALLSAHQSIGVPQPLRLFGTDEQKKKYLPRLAKGAVSAFALTEPEVGSDPARMSTTATPTPDGKHYVINGTKLWCTNGAIADILVVMAQTPPVVEKGREKKQITAFIVEKGTPGFEVVHRCRFLGLNGVQNALLRFTNVKVPAENIIWGPGKGLRLALITLNAGRLSLPAGCIGGVRHCLEIAREWGNERKQWGAPIGRHEAGASKIGSMAAHLFAMEAVTWLSAAWVDDKKHDIRLEAAMAKIFASERTHAIIEDTLQLRGGRGYERASSLKARGEKPYPVERGLRDSRINMIIEGTSEILRLFVAREALDRHLSIAGDVLDSRLPLGRRAACALKAAVFYAGWYPWQWLGQLVSWVNVLRYSGMGPLGRHLRFTARASHRLARATFHLMLRHGPGLEKRQLQLMRLVDIAMDLFAISASIGRARTRPEAVAVADLFCWEARARIAASFRALGTNQDARRRAVAGHVLDGDLRWLEAFQSAGALSEASPSRASSAASSAYPPISRSPVPSASDTKI